MIAYSLLYLFTTQFLFLYTSATLSFQFHRDNPDSNYTVQQYE